MTRKQAREEAFILIFEKGFNDDALEDILSLAEEVRDIKADDYVKKVFFGVFENIENILYEIGKKLGCLVKGGNVDYDKVYSVIVRDLKDGLLGNITFDRIN